MPFVAAGRDARRIPTIGKEGLLAKSLPTDPLALAITGCHVGTSADRRHLVQNLQIFANSPLLPEPPRNDWQRLRAIQIVRAPRIDSIRRSGLTR